MNVLLSIKPCYAELIFSGKKKYEYRKSIFKKKNINKIIIYASSPIKMIVGEIIIDKVIFDDPNKIWLETSDFSGINKENFFKYFSECQMGYAIKIKSSNLYNKPINPREIIREFVAPQSFMYLNVDVV